MSEQPQAGSNPPRDDTLVLAVLQQISCNLKSIDEIVGVAGASLSQGLISPIAAIAMVEQVAPGCFEAVASGLGSGDVDREYTEEAAE